MQIKHLSALAILTMALTGTAFGQWHPDFDIVKARQGRGQSIKSPRDMASGQATGKAAREAGSGLATGRTRQVQPGQNSGGTISNQWRKPHGKYANQEVSYRQAKGNEAAVESLERAKGAKPAVFEPNNEPLWAKQKNRRKQVRKGAKNQDIEVENDETHRTKPRATRTETVNNNETQRTKPRRRKN